ncbi:MAG: DNA-formamidopyrimidine glycosylase family protein [Verrucomicrobiales bacterium]
MPELAEVEYFRKQWNPGLGTSILRVQTHPAARIFRDSPAVAIERGLAGRSFLGSAAHGKQMLFEFSGGAWLGLHLGMSGELRTAPGDRLPAKHEHLVIVLDSLSLVFSDYRMFGKVSLDITEDGLAPSWWRELPPQPADAGFTKTRVRDFMRRFPKTPLKTLLLDQRGFPGIGNWMADEICWQLRIPPQTPSGTLDDLSLEAVWKMTRRVSREALRVIGTDWGELPDSWLMNHRWRDGGICPRRGCKSELVRDDLRGRTTCWCPSCQGG